MTFSHLKTRILLADDHELVLDGLKSLLKNDPEFSVAGTALNGEELIGLLKIHPAEIVITDIDMPVMNGIEAATIISRDFPHVKILALSMHGEAGMIKKMAEAGICGYVLKNISKNELLHALREVRSGRKYFSSEVGSALLDSQSREKADNDVVILLTDREREILQMITEGNSNTEIGEKLFISPRTVDTHRTNIMKKAGVNNIAGLVRFAIKNNLAD